ncbi:protein FAR-RED IMPAIRED RESPONSE 1-like [Camellia sinensis]|uniref:protein FAR-RED IMPAIRED RESPONSE 1-like n=1 Tax=Camellia sinensis TaxID=4442 RepID=UPI0010356620|nr:protein FAR-RED IMPAIRED RESPONSE 1-like [Camellia sinensis]
MDIDSNHPTLSGGEEVEEAENNPSLNESDEIEEPKKGMWFTSKQKVHEFYAKYAKNLGFAIAYRIQNVRSDGKDKSDHTHDLIPSDSRHFPMNKRIRTPVKRRLEINDEAGIGVSRNFHSIIVEAGGYEALTFDERDVRNHIENARRLRLRVGDAESVAFYFHRMQQENSNFYSAIDFDVDGRIQNLFWADARSRAAYKAFGDVKIPEKLRGYSQYEAIKFALQNAVYDSFRKDEFDEEWQTMIEKFSLHDNEWLGVLYAERHRWIPAYVKDIFWAGMSTTQRSESMNAVFDGYVNSKTTLKQFVEQYDNALRSKVEKETKADFKSRDRLYDCLTVYEFEKQFRVASTQMEI